MNRTAKIHAIKATPQKIKAVLGKSTRPFLEASGFAGLLRLSVRLMLDIDRVKISPDGSTPNKQAQHTTILLARACHDHIRLAIDSISRLGKEAILLQKTLSDIESLLCIFSTYHVTLSVTEEFALLELSKRLETEIESALDLIYEKLSEFEPQKNKQQLLATNTENFSRSPPVINCLNSSLSARISALTMTVSALSRDIVSSDGDSQSFLIGHTTDFLDQVKSQIQALNSIYDEVNSGELRQHVCETIDQLIFLEKLVSSNITFSEGDISSVNLITRNIESRLSTLADVVLQVEVKQKAGGGNAHDSLH
ncbi:MAG: hypothetical protein E6Q59_10495 [Nitrosomonas sp.]|nr:MAG: hypothetical protein E6Q59_10495 [Nitrosomonas sp.]